MPAEPTTPACRAPKMSLLATIDLAEAISPSAANHPRFTLYVEYQLRHIRE